MELLIFIFRIFSALRIRIIKIAGNLYAHFCLRKSKCIVGNHVIFNGFPIIDISKKSVVNIGNNFSVNSGSSFNQIGRNQPSYLIVYDQAKLFIGNNVGISSTAIVCFKEIRIEDNVKIGGNTVIYDSDFHSLKQEERCVIPEVKINVKNKSVIIKRNVFIGAHCTILKGVTIGEGSIIGAGSVVRNSVPSNEIWAGNPAVFIKKII